MTPWSLFCYIVMFFWSVTIGGASLAVVWLMILGWIKRARK